MKYCYECGTKLIDKELEHEGIIPFCSKCGQFRFPIFSTAVSIVILNKEQTKSLFVKQYHTTFNRLVAGYINKGESAEEAVVREMSEEIGVKPIEYHLQRTEYFPKSNTLMINYYAIVESEEINPNYEIDSYGWYDVEKGYEALEGAKLAQRFYRYYLDNNYHSR